MDVRNLQYADASFDVVIDKSLLDAMVCGDGAVENVRRMMEEIYRVLTPTGVYFCISHARGSQRRKYLKNNKKFNWKYHKTAIPKPGIGANPKPYKVQNDDEKDKKFVHFVYTLKKQIEPVIDSDNDMQETIPAKEGSPEKEEEKKQ